MDSPSSLISFFTKLHSSSSFSATSSPGISGVVAQLITTSNAFISAIALAISTSVFVLLSFLSDNSLKEEPPVFLSRYPIVGHLVGIMSQQTEYLMSIHRHCRLPIVTLPMVGGKIYAIFDTNLIHAALKHKNLSTEPFNIEVGGKLCDLDGPAIARVLNTEITGSVFSALRKGMHANIHGDKLRQVSTSLLRVLAQEVNNFDTTGDGLTIPDLYVWVRGLMSPVFSKALWGKHDPYGSRQSLYDDFWVFEDATAGLISSPFPRLTHSKAFYCRQRCQTAAIEYYTNRYDQGQDVAPYMKGRADALREVGLTDSDIGKIEFFQFGAAAGNSSATLFWFILYVFENRERVERLRAELRPLLQPVHGQTGQSLRDRQQLSLNIAQVEKQCPYLIACWKETLRLVNVQASVRRVVEDTFLTDGQGNRYLLQKGANAFMPHAVAHRMDPVWSDGEGEDGLTFNPNNFLKPEQSNMKLEKARRAAWIPFGDGAGLCPGRKIAMISHLALLSTLVCGYELENLDDGSSVKRPRSMPMAFGHGIIRPQEGHSPRVRIRQRSGWNNIVWHYELVQDNEY